MRRLRWNGWFGVAVLRRLTFKGNDMKDLLEVLSLFALVGGVLVLFFIFSGEPDLWDKWHERAMADATCAQVKPQ